MPTFEFPLKNPFSKHKPDILEYVNVTEVDQVAQEQALERDFSAIFPHLNVSVLANRYQHQYHDRAITTLKEKGLFDLVADLMKEESCQKMIGELFAINLDWAGVLSNDAFDERLIENIRMFTQDYFASETVNTDKAEEINTIKERLSYPINFINFCKLYAYEATNDFNILADNDSKIRNILILIYEFSSYDSILEVLDDEAVFQVADILVKRFGIDGEQVLRFILRKYFLTFDIESLYQNLNNQSFVVFLIDFFSSVTNTSQELLDFLDDLISAGGHLELEDTFAQQDTHKKNLIVEIFAQRESEKTGRMLYNLIELSESQLELFKKMMSLSPNLSFGRLLELVSTLNHNSFDGLFDDITVELIFELVDEHNIEYVFTNNSLITALNRLSKVDYSPIKTQLKSMLDNFHMIEARAMIEAFLIADPSTLKLFQVMSQEYDLGDELELSQIVQLDVNPTEVEQIISYLSDTEVKSFINSSFMSEYSRVTFFTDARVLEGLEFIKHIIDNDGFINGQVMSEKMTLQEISTQIEAAGTNNLFLIIDLCFNGVANTVGLDVSTESARENNIYNYFYRVGKGIVRKIVEHPNLEKILGQFSFDQLINLVSSGAGLEKSPEFLMAYPEFTKFALELNQRVPDPSQLSWPERLQIFKQFLEVLGIKARDQDLNTLLLEVTNLTIDDIELLTQTMCDNPNHPARVYFEENDFIDQKIWLSYLSEGEKRRVALYIRDILEQTNISGLRVIHEAVARVADPDPEIEEANHPSDLYQIGVGFELEHGLPTFVETIMERAGMVDTDRDTDRMLWLFLEKWGLHLDPKFDRPVEVSPGPFPPAIAGAVIGLLTEYGLVPSLDYRRKVDTDPVTGEQVNIQERVIQNIHFNTGIKNPELAGQVVRILLATGWAFRPIANQFDRKKWGKGETHSVRVYSKVSDVNRERYTEAKAFQNLSPEGSQQLMEDGGTIAIAARAYETIYQQIHQVNDDFLSHHDEGGRRIRIPSLTEDEIIDFEGDESEKELALVWIKLRQSFIDGSTQLGLDSLINMIIPGSQKLIFDDILNELYPNWYDHINDVSDVVVNGQQIEFEGQVFNNIVVFTRFIIQTAIAEISDIFDRLDSDFVNDLVNAYTAPDAEQDPLIETLFDHYPRLTQDEAEVADDETINRNQINARQYYDDLPPDFDESIDELYLGADTWARLRRGNLFFGNEDEEFTEDEDFENSYLDNTSAANEQTEEEKAAQASMQEQQRKAEKKKKRQSRLKELLIKYT